MARRNLIKTAEFPYHVTGRTNNKEWFSITMEECWAIFEHVLEEISQKFNAQVASFVLMSNHFHMILWTPNENLDRIMNYFMHKTSLLINKKSNRINHVFGRRYGWSLIQTSDYLTTVYKYNYQNPIRVNLSKIVEDYRYSTMFYLKNGLPLKFPIYDQKLIELSDIPNEMNRRLDWLNDRFNEEQNEMIRKCIKKSIFEFPKHKQFKKLIKNLRVQK